MNWRPNPKNPLTLGQGLARLPHQAAQDWGQGGLVNNNPVIPMPLQKPLSVMTKYGPASYMQAFANTAGTFGQKKPIVEHIGDILGTVGALNPASTFTNLTMGPIGSAFQAGTNLVTGKPINQNLGEAWQSGMQMGFKLAPLSTAANALLKPVLSKLAPVAINNINDYLKLAQTTATQAEAQFITKNLAKWVIQNVGKEAVAGAVGMGAYGATMPAKTLQDRLANIFNNGLQGAAFSAASKGVGYGTQYGMANYKNMPLGMSTKDVSDYSPEGIAKAKNQIAKDFKAGKLTGEEAYSKLKWIEDKATEFNPTTAMIKKAKVNPKTLKASYKQKAFLETVQTAETTGKAVKKVIGEIEPQKYQQSPAYLKKLANWATKTIKADPEGSYTKVMSDEVSPESLALGMKLAKHYEGLGETAKVAEIVSNMDVKFRQAGRVVDVAKLWGSLKPSTIVNMAEKIATNHKVELSTAIKKEIEVTSYKISLMKDSPMKVEAITKLQNFIADKIPLSLGEKITEYRYQNMLSGIGTHARNVMWNIGSTFVTRPANLFWESVLSKIPGREKTASFSEIPAYYKSVFKSLNEAGTTVGEQFKPGADLDTKYLTQGPEMSQFGIEQARRSKSNYLGRLPTKLLAAEDKAFSVLIQNAEKERLVGRGIDATTATTQAHELAAEYLLHNRLGKSSASDPWAVRLLDKIGIVLTHGKAEKIGMDWVAPFINVPVNVAKMSAANSPLGFAGGNWSNPQLAKALSGSVVTALGTFFAVNGLVSLSGPKDENGKAITYASGRKVASVKIGNKWIPLDYLGAFKLAFLIPAIIQESFTKKPTSGLTSKTLNAISQLSKIVVEQTPLQGVSNFLKMATGEEAWNPGKWGGYILAQGIPAQGLMRNLAQIIDPRYLKTSGLWDTLFSGVPGASKIFNMPAYTQPSGLPSTKGRFESMLPYSVGTSVPGYERIVKLRENVTVYNNIEKKIEDLAASGDRKAAGALAMKYKNQLRIGQGSKVLTDSVNKLMKVAEDIQADQKLTDAQKQAAFKALEKKIFAVVGK